MVGSYYIHSYEVKREQEVELGYKISRPTSRGLLPLARSHLLWASQPSKQSHLLGFSVCAPVGDASHSNHSNRHCSTVLAGGYLKVALDHLPFLHLLTIFYLLGFMLSTEKTKTDSTVAGTKNQRRWLC